MQTLAAAAPYFLPFVLPLCVWVMWSDLARMKIPNTAVLALAGVFLAIGPFVLPFEDYLGHVVAGVVMFFVGWALNAMRVMGAGDGKFLAAAAPYVPLEPRFTLPLVMLFTLVLLVTFGLHRLLRAIPKGRAFAPGWASWTAKKFPMGLPLALTLAIMMTRFAFKV